METTSLIKSPSTQNYNPLAYRGGVINYSNNQHYQNNSNGGCCDNCCIDIVPTTDNYVYKDYNRNFIYVRYHRSNIEKLFICIRFVANMICTALFISYIVKYN